VAHCCISRARAQLHWRAGPIWQSSRIAHSRFTDLWPPLDRVVSPTEYTGFLARTSNADLPSVIYGSSPQCSPVGFHRADLSVVYKSQAPRHPWPNIETRLASLGRIREKHRCRGGISDSIVVRTVGGAWDLPRARGRAAVAASPRIGRLWRWNCSPGVWHRRGTAPCRGRVSTRL
jgi:hypothetical protein